MNGKPDEHLDQWVRQSLNRLPDAPPPGTAFDKERLWVQLRPELQPSANPRRRVWGWWAAAACLAGIVLGWFIVDQPQPEQRVTVAQEKRPDAQSLIDQKSKAEIEPERVAGVVSTTSRPYVKKKILGTAPVPAPSGEGTAPTVVMSSESTVNTRPDSTVSTAPARASAVVVSLPKRRFQVVHLNELQAEEEIRPGPYRTERFVRLGMGNTGTPMPETSHPSISLPINSKSNQ